MATCWDKPTKQGAEDCLQWCLEVPECRIADFYLSLKLCVIQDITVLDVSVSDWITGSSTDYTHYQDSGLSRNSMHTTTTRCSGCFGHLYDDVLTVYRPPVMMF